MRRATWRKGQDTQAYCHFNPRSPWGERLYTFIAPRRPCGISIHALREESDCVQLTFFAINMKFQSTLSVRRATWCSFWFCDSCFDFNPRSPWGERRLSPIAFAAELSISIHALREESDTKLKEKVGNPIYFNPRSPWGERQLSRVTKRYFLSISIHALREESDWSFNTPWTAKNTFQSTLSVRRATLVQHNLIHFKTFQSTLSVRRATTLQVLTSPCQRISINALREESDSKGVYFLLLERLISINALREESDL